jgi:hypothetical protein
VWLGIQVLGLAGKKGKPRIDLGWMRRPDPARPNVVRIEGRGKNLLFLEGNRVRIETAEAPGWNAGRFRRSLHYLGLNYLALIQGPSFVLQEKFDRVRRYVRSPRPGERWVYGEVRTSNKLLSQIGMRQIAGAPGEIIAIQLFSTAFIVDLLNGTEFGSWLRSAVPGVLIH